MKILTIIVSYNFERWMKPCLESLTHSVHPTDVLVIDNGSTDHTVSLLREAYPWVHLIANGENLAASGVRHPLACASERGGKRAG